MTQETNAALDVRSSSSLDISQIMELEKALLGEGELPDVSQDPEEAGRDILMRILYAENDDEAEQVNTAIGWAELAGIPIEIQGFKWLPSTIEGSGTSMYIVVFGYRMDEYEEVALTTSSKNVIAQILNYAKRDKLPCIRMLEVADKPTKRGYYPQKLVSTPAELERRAAEKKAAISAARAEAESKDKETAKK